jgi:hypothetical protein
MCVGPCRINEAMATLSFDYNLITKPTHTYIISPYSNSAFTKLFKEFDIDSSMFTILSDNYFDQYYDLTLWSHNAWYLQQAFKLCALDHIDSEYFLIQDCDLILLQPYDILADGVLTYKAENLWNSHQHVYASMVKELLGMDRVIECSLVNEIMPVTKRDWLAIKELIQSRFNQSWQTAIPSIRAFDDSKWFSEYELLGIYRTNKSSKWQHFVTTSQPAINTWDDFYRTDWQQQHSLKFHAPPLKFMTSEQTHKVIDYIKELTST